MKGISICENLYSTIFKKGTLSGQVHSVFKNACNIESDDLFITLLSKEKKMCPMSVALDLGDNFNFIDLDITKGSMFKFNKSKIYCVQKNLFLDISNARLWQSHAKLEASNCLEHKFLDNIKIIEKGLKTFGKPQGMVPLINYLSHKLPELGLVIINECYFDKSHEFVKHRFINFISAVLKVDMNDIGALAQRVIGFGCGLTPAMDDFIAGVMITYIYMASYYKLDLQKILEFNNKIICLGLYKTTRVSSEMLKHASIGDTNEAVNNLMKAMLNFNDDNDEKNHENIMDALVEVIGYGETSGTDTILGIYVALRILTNLNYRRVWLNEYLC